MVVLDDTGDKRKSSDLKKLVQNNRVFKKFFFECATPLINETNEVRKHLREQRFHSPDGSQKTSLLLSTSIIIIIIVIIRESLYSIRLMFSKKYFTFVMQCNVI